MDEQKKKFDANTIIIIATIVIAALIIGGSIWANKSGGGTPVTQNAGSSGLEIGDAPVVGNADAPNTIVEFLDFQCPYCERFFAQVEPQLRSTYIDTGKAKMVYKTLTFIDSFDKNADPQESLLAAQAAECSKEQGKYEPMHDAIYNAERAEADAGKTTENSGNLTPQFFAQTAQTIGLDMNTFNSCIGSARIADLLTVYTNDANEAMNGKVSTPTVFVNGTKLNNPFDMSEYQGLIK